MADTPTTTTDTEAVTPLEFEVTVLGGQHHLDLRALTIGEISFIEAHASDWGLLVNDIAVALLRGELPMHIGAGLAALAAARIMPKHDVTDVLKELENELGSSIRFRYLEPDATKDEAGPTPPAPSKAARKPKSAASGAQN